MTINRHLTDRFFNHYKEKLTKMGYTLQSVSEQFIRDRYFDTETNSLFNLGYYFRIRTRSEQPNKIITFRAFEATGARLTLWSDKNEPLTKKSLRETLIDFTKKLKLETPPGISYELMEYPQIFKKFNLIYLLELENQRKTYNILLTSEKICKLNVDSVMYSINNNQIPYYEIEFVFEIPDQMRELEQLIGALSIELPEVLKTTKITKLERGLLLKSSENLSEYSF